jgi:hypothetical protein
MIAAGSLRQSQPLPSSLNGIATPYRAPLYADDDKGRAQDALSSAAHPVVSSRWLPHVLALALIGYWLLVKSVLFHRLEYSTDLFTDLELTRSFFEGRPLLWGNGYGDHKHSTITTLPFCSIH